MKNFFSTFEEILGFLHDLFELFQHLKNRFLRFSPRVLEIWSKHGSVIAQVLSISYSAIQNICDYEVQTLVLELLNSFIGGIPTVIQLILIYIYLNQIRIIYDNRETLSKTLAQFSVFEEKIIKLHNMTAELEVLVAQYLSSENSNPEQLEFIKIKFETVKTFGEKEFIQQLEQFRLEMHIQLKKFKETQNNLRQSVLGSVVSGAGTVWMAGVSTISPPVAVVGFALCALFGTSAAYYDRQVSKDIQQINETLEKLNLYHQLAKEMLQKIKNLEIFNSEPLIIKYCFAIAFGFSFFALLLNKFL